MWRLLALLALLSPGAPAFSQTSCSTTIKWVSNSPGLPDSAMSGVVAIIASPAPAIGYTGGTWSFPVSVGVATITVPNTPLTITITFTATGAVSPTQTAVVQQGLQCADKLLAVPSGVGPLQIT